MEAIGNISDEYIDEFKEVKSANRRYIIIKRISVSIAAVFVLLMSFTLLKYYVNNNSADIYFVVNQTGEQSIKQSEEYPEDYVFIETSENKIVFILGDDKYIGIKTSVESIGDEYKFSGKLYVGNSVCDIFLNQKNESIYLKFDNGNIYYCEMEKD